MKNLLPIVALLMVPAVSTVAFGQTSSDPIKDNTTPRSEAASPLAKVSGNVASGPSSPSKPEPAANEALNLIEIYRVGLGDVLDVRLMNSASASRSTLFTVVAGGMIDVPLVGGPIQVAGLTTDEIQMRLASELKRRAIQEDAQVSVGVRQYVSHSVMVTGLVAAPGVRILRREAVPLYVVLAESQLRNDAGRITIMRNGSMSQTLSLSDPQALNATVMSGDVITVAGQLQEFYYIAGKINYPGQKDFRTGLTLLQAILAAGGTAKQSNTTVEISREGGNGRLVTSRFDLKQIKAGGVADPKLQPGDRIEVLR